MSVSWPRVERQDDGAPGDNQLGATRLFSSPQRAQGRTSVSRSHAWPYGWDTLNEDGGAAGVADDEIHAVVKLAPAAHHVDDGEPHASGAVTLTA